MDGGAQLRPRSVLLLALRRPARPAAGGPGVGGAVPPRTRSGSRALVFLAAALGGYTPLYPLARKLFPPLLYFRFPVKYIVFAVFACAVLAAEGFAAILAGGRTTAAPRDGHRTAVAAEPGWSSPSLGLPGDRSPRSAAARHRRRALARWLAESTHLKDPAAGAAFLARAAPPLLARAFGLLLAGGAVWSPPRPARASPAAALFCATCVDLAGRQRRPEPDDRAREARAAGRGTPSRPAPSASTSADASADS